MSKTTIAIDGDKFRIDGEFPNAGRQWRGRPIEGLLFNSRMANAIVDDENPETRGVWAYPDGPWDAERNTREFCEALPAYREHGLQAININLQGGSPTGYAWNQPWVISGFDAEGHLKPAYQRRLAMVLDAADRLGMVVVLGLFYGAASRHLRDEDSVRTAVAQTVDWLAERQDKHVLLEIANEVDVQPFAHPIVHVSRCDELIRLAQQLSKDRFATPAGRLLVSASLADVRQLAANVIGASDFLLPHGNRLNAITGHGHSSPDSLRLHVAQLRASPAYRGQPIFYNEDDHFDFDKPDNHLLAATECGVGWGFFDFRQVKEKYPDGFQSLPVDWRIGSERKRGFFGTLKAITGA